jgi:diguanylate cyclase (GGDEF)-like protein
LALDREALLRDLDLAVTEFEYIADRGQARMATIQNITFYAAIIVILIEGIAIFLPAQLIVTRSIDRLEAQSNALSKAQVISISRNKELESLRAVLEHEALHDSLTGLPNRRSLERTLRKLEASSEAQSAMHIDLDRFKAINDTLGHAAGDYILQHVAKTLRACTSKDDIIARVGGDEFVVLPAAGSTVMDLKDLSERIIKEMGKPVHYQESICQFGASIGICIDISQGEKDANDTRDLLVRADVALYKAKELGLGRYEFFSDELSERVEAAKLNANELLLAFERNEFTVHYQPIFHAKSRTISSMEALVRWDHPTYGLKAAGSFIDDVKKSDSDWNSTVPSSPRSKTMFVWQNAEALSYLGLR